MNCDCDVTSGVKEFPDNLVCVLVDGFGSTVPRKKKYLGGKNRLVDFLTITIEVLVKSEVDAAVLLEWWVSELDYGTKTFLIYLPYFGIRKKWTASIVGDMPETIVIGKTRNVKLRLKIYDDLSESILKNKCKEC